MREKKTKKIKKKEPSFESFVSDVPVFRFKRCDWGRRPVLNIACLGMLYTVVGAIDPKRRSAELSWRAFMNLWLRVFGAPACLLFDEGNEFDPAQRDQSSASL